MTTASSDQSADMAAVAAVRDAWVAAVAARDTEAITDLLTDDYEVWAHGVAPIHGPQAAVAAMRAALDRFTIEQRFEPIETVVAGEMGVRARHRAHDGDASGRRRAADHVAAGAAHPAARTGWALALRPWHDERIAGPHPG